MGRKACLLTSKDVPNYIRDIARRLEPVMLSYQDKEGNEWFGYVFKLNAKWRCGYESQLEKDAERLVKWCKGWYAHSEIIKYRFWYDAFPHKVSGDWKARKRKAWKCGFRNSVLLVISDPVAYRFEKDGYINR